MPITDLISLRRLAEVHPDLQRVAHLAQDITFRRIRITEGLRDAKRQAQLVAAGSSWTMNSRHLTGHAVDFVALVGGNIDYSWPAITDIADAFKEAARRLNIPITRGIDWKVKDGPHIELAWRFYPKEPPWQGKEV